MHAAAALLLLFSFSFRQFRGLERAEATTARRKHPRAIAFLADDQAQPSPSNACSN